MADPKPFRPLSSLGEGEKTDLDVDRRFPPTQAFPKARGVSIAEKELRSSRGRRAEG